MTTQDLTAIVEDREDSLPSQKEAKKDQKIIKNKLISSSTNNCTTSLVLMSMELHVNTRGNLNDFSDNLNSSLDFHFWNKLS